MGNVIEIKRGNVYIASMPNYGESVQFGIRPVIVVQNNKGNAYSPTIQVIPLTSKKKNLLPVHTVVTGCKFKTKSLALTEQLQTISKSSIIRYIGTADSNTMKRIENCIKIQLGLE